MVARPTSGRLQFLLMTILMVVASTSPIGAQQAHARSAKSGATITVPPHGGGRGQVQRPEQHAHRPASPSEPSKPDHVPGYGSSLHAGEFALGLRQMRVGITDFLELRVLPVFWFAGLPFGTVFPNLYTTFTLRPHKALEVQLRGGAMFMNLGRVANRLGGSSAKGVKSRVVITTLEAGIRGRLGDFDLSLHPTLAYVAGDFGADIDVANLGAGMATSMITVRSEVAYWLSRRSNVFLDGRYTPWADDSVVAVGGRAGQTTVQGVLQTPDVVFKNRYELLAGTSWTLGILTLRLAAGYGDFFLPNLGVLVPTGSLTFEGDISFRFGG